MKTTNLNLTHYPKELAEAEYFPMQGPDVATTQSSRFPGSSHRDFTVKVIFQQCDKGTIEILGRVHRKMLSCSCGLPRYVVEGKH